MSVNIQKTKPVVVIGAGIGGLTAAIALAAKKIPVVVLERHAHPGGKMRQLFVAGQAIDAGPTVFTMRWVFENLFASVGLEFSEHLRLDKADLLARHSWQGSDSLDLFTELDQSIQAISEFAGNSEADNYLQFARKTKQVFNTLDHSFMRAQRPNPIALGLQGGLSGIVDMAKTHPFETLWNALSKDFSDPRLRQLFARYATYCGSSPFKAPATLMLLAHVERTGVWMVQGGMHALARTLANTLELLGGEIRYGTGVAKLDIDDKQINSVQLENGESLSTHAVIFNGDTQALAKGLLGEPATEACAPRPEASLSAVTHCQYAITHGYPLAHHTVFFGNDYADEFEGIFDRSELTDNPTVYVCAQDRSGSADTTIADKQHERLFSMVNAPGRPMGDAERSEAIERMKQTLNSQGLQIDDEKGQSIITGPSQYGRLFPASDGALYGRPTHGWMGSFKRPGSRSSIRGLYLCGDSVHPGAGVPMASLSGQLAAESLCADGFASA